MAQNLTSLSLLGPAGVLLNLLDRHPMRPAHIHLMVTAPDFLAVTTQIFPDDDQYLTNDTVFAVKDDLIVNFAPLEDKTATLQMEYNVILAPKSMQAPKTQVVVPEVPIREENKAREGSRL